MEPIKILKYLADNNADPDTREALNMAIQALNCAKNSNKLLTVKKQLDKIEVTDPDFVNKVKEATKDLEYPEHEWVPKSLRELLRFIGTETSPDEFKFDKEVLDKYLHVFEDDGMGYGAYNCYVFDMCKNNDDIQLWI